MATVRVNLPDELKAFAEARAANGGHASLDAYLESLIRADAALDADLESLLDSRMDGPSVEATSQFWNEWKARVREQRPNKAAS